MPSMKRAVARRLSIEPLEGRAMLSATSLPTVSIADGTMLEGALAEIERLLLAASGFNPAA
ncbi:MAG: hypothetical protein WCO90_04350, partial [Planctomycetota bacterium]